MVAYSFQKQFAEPILAGTKGGTIRADRKRHARPGEDLQLYTGMRTKHCRLIARRRCLAVEPIELRLRPDAIFFPFSVIVSARRLDAFARFDGFADWDALRAFWRETHEALDVFAGQNIRWLPLPEALVT